MDRRTRQIIVVIHNHEIIFAGKTLTDIVDAMIGFETNFITRQTLSDKLSQFRFYCFISPTGKVYDFYSYDNPDYRPQVRKVKKS